MSYFIFKLNFCTYRPYRLRAVFCAMLCEVDTIISDNERLTRSLFHKEQKSPDYELLQVK